MSTPPPPLPPPPPPSPTHYYLTNLGLGYAIAVAFGFLLLLSCLFLASFICFQRRRHNHTLNHNNNHNQNHNHRLRNPSDGGVILPSIIFVDETNEEELNVVVGLDQAVINSYPKFPYTNGMCNGISNGIGNGIDAVCAICLCEYKEAEMMRMLPDCKHCFHLVCVDAWLKLNATCPVCRSSPLPTPLSTPLAEVVPLAQYSDGRRRR